MRDRLYIDAMEEVLSNTTKVIIDQKANSNLLFLPLDKLIQSAAGVAASGIAGGDIDGSATPPATDENRRTREAFRSRTREER
jgi:membrane protease subunit HflK